MTEHVWMIKGEIYVLNSLENLLLEGVVEHILTDAPIEYLGPL